MRYILLLIVLISIQKVKAESVSFTELVAACKGVLNSQQLTSNVQSCDPRYSDSQVCQIIYNNFKTQYENSADTIRSAKIWFKRSEKLIDQQIRRVAHLYSKEQLRMLIDQNYDGENFKLTHKFFKDEMEDNKIQFDPEIGKKVAIIYIDIYGNEKIEIIDSIKFVKK